MRLPAAAVVEPQMQIILSHFSCKTVTTTTNTQSYVNVMLLMMKLQEQHSVSTFKTFTLHSSSLLLLMITCPLQAKLLISMTTMLLGCVIRVCSYFGKSCAHWNPSTASESCIQIHSIASPPTATTSSSTHPLLFLFLLMTWSKIWFECKNPKLVTHTKSRNHLF